MGKKLYGHTKLIDIKNKSLVVVVDHPGWLQIVKLNERIIIKKIQKMFPQLSVKSMKTSVKQEFFKEERDFHEQEQEKYEKEEKNTEIRENSEKFKIIGDEQLRNTLKRLYVSIIKNKEES